MSGQIPRLGLGEESIPPGEADLIDQLVRIHREIQELGDRKRSPVPRGQHPKSHGCVHAEFTISADLPKAYRYGLFSEPRTYQALIRFSNGTQWDDTKPDVHGMAIKILNVDGERVPGAGGSNNRTQDFIMVDVPVFFIRNLVDYVPLLEDLRRFKTPGLSIGKIATVLKVLFSSNYKYRMLRASRRKINNPLCNQYWSTTPFKLGPTAMKFSAWTPSKEASPALAPNSKDKLRQAMSAQLKNREACFDFLIQLQTDAVSMPIEDPTVAWDEKVSPYLKAATIRIGAQSFESKEQMAFCENLTFTPWHCLAEHRPLGGVNRARRRVYEAISGRRHELNGAPMQEPNA